MRFDNSNILIMSISKISKESTHSRRSTEEDSGSEKDEDHYYYYCKTNPAKHKTELCKTFSVMGYCPY